MGSMLDVGVNGIALITTFAVTMMTMLSMLSAIMGMRTIFTLGEELFGHFGSEIKNPTSNEVGQCHGDHEQG